MRRLILLVRTTSVACALALVLVTVAPSEQAARASAGDDEFAFLWLVNQERSKRGLPALAFASAGQPMAEEWSRTMMSRGRLAHRPDGQQRWLIGQFAPSWRRLGENVGYGRSISWLHNAFMDSPSHRANVLGDYTHVSIGAVTHPNGRIWVTFNFVKTTDRLVRVGNFRPSSAPPPPPLVGTTRLVPTNPVRVLDTRHGVGHRGGRPPGGHVLPLRVIGRAGVPADQKRVRAVVLNVTATRTAADGYVTVWPTGRSRPLASNVNFQRAGQTVANQVIVPVGRDGQVNLYPSASAHLVVDVAGWFEPASRSTRGRYTDLEPARLLDSRRTAGGARRPPGSTTAVPVLGRGGVPASGVSAVALNVTVTETDRTGHLTAWGDGPRPVASNLNTERSGQTIANQVIVPVGRDGAVRFYNSMPAHLVVDVTGWYTDHTAAASRSGLFVPLSAYRAVDSRQYNLRARRESEWDLDLRGANWSAAAVTVTVVDASDGGHLTVWGGGNRPSTSTVNTDRPGQIIPNAATVTGAGDSAIRVFNGTESHVVIDVNGFYTG